MSGSGPRTYTWNTDTNGKWSDTTIGLWARSSGGNNFPGNNDPGDIAFITATGSPIPFDYTISEDVATKIGALTVNGTDGDAIPTLAFDALGVTLTVTGLTTLTAGVINLSTTGALTTGTFLGNGGTFTESSGKLAVTGAGPALSVTGGTFALSGGAVTVANSASFTGGTDTISSGTFTASDITIGGVSTLLTLSGGTVTTTASSANASSIGISDTISMSGSAILDFTNAGTNVNAGLKNDGSLIGAGTVKGLLSGAGVIESTGGKLELTSNIAGNSNLTFDIGTTSFLQVDGTLGSGNTFTFLAPSGALAYNNAATKITENVVGLNVGSSATVPTNYVDFMQSVVTVNDSNAHTGSTAAVSLSDGSILNLSGITAPGAWFVDAVSDVGGAGTNIFLSSAACFLHGTRILTPAGEVPIEDLAIGDRLITVSGATKPIRWIGRRSYSKRFAAGNRAVLPILIRADALADNVPRRDLMVSPKHAMFVDGMLIPAEHLINGVSVVQLEAVEEIAYFHVELEEHDVIHAEGALSETYVDDDNRGMFHNAHEFHGLYPDVYPTPVRYFAKRVEDGYELEAILKRIDVRAGLRQRDDPRAPATLRGSLDYAGPDLIQGWAQNSDHPEAPVCVDVFDNGVLIARTLANRYRPDLKKANLGSGRHSFEVKIPAGLCPLSRHVIQVIRSSDGAPLGSARVVELSGEGSAQIAA